MKYIKKFFEELDPKKFIRAGQRLQSLGKQKKGADLIDYGLKQLYGSYNIHLATSYSNKVMTGWVSKPVCNFYYGFPEKYGAKGFQNVNGLPANIDEEKLVDLWKNGDSDLGFTIDFRFEPSQEFLALPDFKINDLEDKIILSKNPGQNLPSDFKSGVHLFSVRVLMALKSANDDLEDEGISINSASDLYETCRLIDIRLSSQTDHRFFGVFADRKSALTFKRKLPELIEPHKSKIMDLLTVLQASSNDLEDILEQIYSITVNEIYLPDKPNYNDVRKLIKQ
jgi:hypothetical protein